MKKGDTVKAYVIEKTNQYGSTYFDRSLTDRMVSNFRTPWVKDVCNADMYDKLQDCKNDASYLIGKFIEEHQQYPDVFQVVDDIKVRKLEIKFLN